MLGHNMVLPVPFILELLIAACEMEDAEEWESLDLAWFSTGDFLLNGVKLGFMVVNVESLSVRTVGCRYSGVQAGICFVDISA